MTENIADPVAGQLEAPCFHVGSENTTRCGFPARIYATDGGLHGTIIHGAVRTNAFGWYPFSWRSDGRAYQTDQIHDYDLMLKHP